MRRKQVEHVGGINFHDYSKAHNKQDVINIKKIKKIYKKKKKKNSWKFQKRVKYKPPKSNT